MAKTINSQAIICLYGDLGCGKTTFTQGFAGYFGIKRIISPTFVIIKKYQVSSIKYQAIKTIYHIDLYRLENVEEIKAVGLEEIINDKNAIVIIEWAERMGELLPKNRIDIKFRYVGENEREIIVSLRA